MRLIAILIVCAVCCSAMAQSDAFGGFAPMNKKPVNKKAVQNRVVSLPDKKNLTDINGRKQGEWAKKYPNGQYMYVATFVDDKPVGTVTRYAEDGKKTSEMKYSAKSDTVYAVYYSVKEKVAAVGCYYNRQKTGEWKYYDEETGSKVIATEQYKNDKLNGMARLFYPSGKVADETIYVDGVKEGVWHQYLPDGAKRLEAKYVKGELDGNYLFWSDKGLISVIGKFKNGVHVGNWKIYEDDSTTEYYVMKYDDNGKLLNEEEVQNRVNKWFEKMESMRKDIIDPADYVNDPESYRP